MANVILTAAARADLKEIKDYQGDNVIVDRVLYGRRNYMKILFGNELQEE